MAFDLSGYTDVATRLDMAFHQYPDIRIQEIHREIVGVGDNLFVSVRVCVWRTADDPLPVIAESWQEYPGRSQFTRGSEYENASTSAIGRALRFAGIGPSGPIASADEVRIAQADQPLPPQATRTADHPAGTGPASTKQVAYIRGLMRSHGVDNWTPPDLFTSADASALISELKAEAGE